MNITSYLNPQYVLNLPFMSQMEDKNHAKGRWRSEESVLECNLRKVDLNKSKYAAAASFRERPWEQSNGKQRA